MWGGGRITAWNDRLYWGSSQIVQRVLMNGHADPAFIHMNSGPYFLSLQGGDYHVFPDGRVVMSGAHTLSDTVRGFTGLHQFIWFTNTGYLDTTRVHRKANGVLYEFEELPDGKFIITGLASTYGGQPVWRVFRLHADGSLDTTFQTGVEWGEAKAYLPLDDGRIYAVGYFRLQNAPQDTLRLVRFLQDGSLDPSFTSPVFGLGTLPNYLYLGARLRGIDPWPGGRLVVTGTFQTVNGHERRGICMLDSNGTLLQAFDAQGIWPYVHMPGTPNEQVYASLGGIVPYDQNRYLVWGAYHGYDDGITNDLSQRFVSRLFGEDISTAVEGERDTADLHVYPNPASGHVTVELNGPVASGEFLLRDALGREVLQQRITGPRHVLDVAGLAEGIYLIEVQSQEGWQGAQRLVVQR